MFKLSVITDEVSQDVNRVLTFGKDFGLEGLELRSIEETPVEKISLTQARRLKSLFDGEGFAICSIASPVFKCRWDSPTEIQAHLEYLKHLVELAHIWETPLIRVFTFWRESVTGGVQAAVEKFLPAVPIADAAGVFLGVENEDSTFVGSGAELTEFLGLVQHLRVKAIWDPQNAFYRTRGTETAVEGYRAVKPWLAHVHVKDAQLDPQTGEPVAAELGKGAIDWTAQLKALKSDSYTGFLSLETHWREVPLDEKILNQPGGAAFSDKGEMASRICMKNLKQMLKELT